MSEKEPNNPGDHLTAAMDAYFKRATELEEQRAKKAQELDERRAKEAQELDQQRAKEARELDQQRAKEARELDQQRAKEARELDQQRAKKAQEIDERRAKKAQELDERRAKKAQELDERRAKKAQELDERRAEADKQRAKEAEKRAAEAAEDTNKLKKAMEELAKQMKETDKKYGSVFNNTGSVTEETFFQALKSDKHIGNTTFRSLQRNICLTEDKPNGRSVELDIVMHNGIYSLIIEVKYLCHLNDVDRFEKKMRKAHAYISKEFNNRKLLFGMAANKFNKDAADYAHEHGMITFHPDGQKVRVDTTACTLVHSDTSE